PRRFGAHFVPALDEVTGLDRLPVDVNEPPGTSRLGLTASFVQTCSREPAIDARSAKTESVEVLHEMTVAHVPMWSDVDCGGPFRPLGAPRWYEVTSHHPSHGSMVARERCERTRRPLEFVEFPLKRGRLTAVPQGWH